MKSLRALDLFCGGGGAALGLFQAGFDEVVGIDIAHKHHKIYPGTFIQADIESLPVKVEDFDFVWASPPCQKFSRGTRLHNKRIYIDLIPTTREVFNGHPFTCIENVPGAPIRKDVILSGPMFGLDRFVRERHFETSFMCLTEKPILKLPKDSWYSGYAMTITKSLSCPSHFYPRKRNGLAGTIRPEEACEAMGIDLPMSAAQVGEAIPPAYSEFIGREAIKQIRRENGK